MLPTPGSRNGAEWKNPLECSEAGLLWEKFWAEEPACAKGMEQKRSWYVKDAEIRPGRPEQSVTPPLHRVDLRQVPSALGVIIQCDGGNSDCSPWMCLALCWAENRTHPRLMCWLWSSPLTWIACSSFLSTYKDRNSLKESIKATQFSW